jgi:hypothetical protein
MARYLDQAEPTPDATQLFRGKANTVCPATRLALNAVKRAGLEQAEWERLFK